MVLGVCGWVKPDRRTDNSLGTNPLLDASRRKKKTAVTFSPDHRVYFQRVKTAYTFMNLHVVILWRGENERENWGMKVVFLFLGWGVLTKYIQNQCSLCCVGSCVPRSGVAEGKKVKGKILWPLLLSFYTGISPWVRMFLDRLKIKDLKRRNLTSLALVYAIVFLSKWMYLWATTNTSCQIWIRKKNRFLA